MKRKKITLETLKGDLIKQREILREIEKDLANPHTSNIIRLTRKGQVESVREVVKFLEEEIEKQTPKVRVRFT